MLRLTLLRFVQDYSQTDVCAKAQMLQSELSRIETGSRQPTLEQRQALALALGCEPARLTDIIDEFLLREIMVIIS